MQNIPQNPKEKQKGLMQKVDLFIPTYNRPEYLKRILNYYALQKVNFNIIIADSSSSSNKKLNKKISSLFPKLKIRYLDKFSEKQVSHHKFAEMVKYSKSKYCVFCADDDFIVPNGIMESVEFLENNPDYSSAHGSYISFYTPTTFIRKKKFWWNFIYPYRSITSSDPSKRLILHPIDCQQVLYAVRKTDLVKTCYKALINSKVDPKLFGERLPDVLTIVYGKMKRLNNFYGARQAFSSSYSYWPAERDYIKAGTFENEYNKFKASIVKNLKKISNITIDTATKIVDNNMQLYLKSSYQQYLVAQIYLVLSKYFPKFVYSFLILLHAKYLFSKAKRDPIGLIDNPKSKYFKDFNQIKEVVINN